MATNTLITSATKCLTAFTGKNDGSYFCIFAANIHCINHLLYGEWSKCIVHVWPVDADSGYTLKFLEENFLVLFYWFPWIFITHNSFLLSALSCQRYFCSIRCYSPVQ